MAERSRFRTISKWSSGVAEYKRSRDIHKANNELSKLQVMRNNDFNIPRTGVFARYAYKDEHKLDVTHACFCVVDRSGKYIFNVNDELSYPARGWTDGWIDKKLRYPDYERPLMGRKVALHSIDHGGACSLLSQCLALLYEKKFNCDINAFIRHLLDPNLTDHILVAECINL